MPAEFNVTTGATLAAQNANNLPAAWEEGAILSEYEHDIMSRFEGSSKEAAIPVKTLPVAAGATMYFRTDEGFYWDGVSGDSLISDSPGPETVNMDAFSLVVDYRRHAAKTNKRAGLVTGLGAEIANRFNQKLGAWMGRKKTADLLMLLTRGVPAENVFYAGTSASPSGSREGLKSSHTVSIGTITTIAQALKTWGAQPARLSTDPTTGRPIRGFQFLGLGESWLSLRNSTTWLDAAKYAQERGLGNTLFKGGMVPIENNVLIDWDPPDHAGAGSVGSALNPRAKLGAAIAAGTTAIDILGGGKAAFSTVTQAKYFEFFSNAPYTYGTGNTIAADTSTDRYCIIYNLTGASANKWGFYRFRINNGNKLTLHSAASRLAAAASGVAHTTVGNVTWDSTKNTDAHPEGSLIIETNSYGVPFARTVVLGAMAAFRGYSSLERMVREQETTEGGFLITTFIRSIFGQALYKRLDGRYPNVAVVESALNYAGLNLPVVAA